MQEEFTVVDMFCGAGGESTGIKLAAQELGINVRLTAINHWDRAIETHAANHPDAEHLCQSVEHIDPVKAVPGRRLDLLWASPECTHHSVARGGRPRSDQSRASAWLILKWLSELYVERVIIENVPEFISWGPLDGTGRPVQSQKGKTFRAFVASLRSLGYSADWKVLTAADYGDPTTRRRLFIQAVKGRKRILWPEITHMDGAENLMGYKPWRPAREIIDWSVPGTSIFDRKRPLAEATIRRIAAGIEKYWKDYAKPFLAVLYGTGNTQSLDLPLSTITSSGAHHALIEPFIMSIAHSSAKKRNRSIDDPLSTVVGKQEHCLIEPLLVEYHGTSKPFPVSLPVKTVTTKDRFGLLEPFLLKVNHAGGHRVASIDSPLKTLTTKRDTAICYPTYSLDIRFRMLKNHELKLAQGFPDDYQITGNITEQTKQIGNAVPVNTAKALALAVMGA
ncbi:MAG: DNA cytosine methyltransferase [Treponema sp.]|jgi:DNA (cytosine-5)-methyltransferase 1|nr:DNA cytosine methyltransferase [Treponema sp.]